MINPPDNLPPHSIEAEQSVLGCVMTWPDECLDTVSEIISDPDAFFDLRHRDAWLCIREIASENQPPFLQTVFMRRKDAGANASELAYLATLPDAGISATQARSVAETVWDRYTRRKIIHAARSLAVEASDVQMETDTAIGNLESALASTSRIEDGAQVSKVAVQAFINRLQDRMANQGKLSGLPTGIHYLDANTDGLQIGEMTVIGARPSIGKTAKGMGIVNAVCIEAGIPTLVVTCEMPPHALVRRLVSLVGNVPMQALKTADVTEGHMAAIQRANSKIARAPLYFLDAVGKANITRICASIRRHARKHAVKLVVVDYLQQISGSQRHEKRTYEVGEVSSKLKGAAVGSQVAVVALAQLNRESEKEKTRPPRLSDLGDSKQIEQDADLILLLHRDRMKPQGEAGIYVAKQRDGETTVINCWYDGRYCKFQQTETRIDE